MTQAVADGKDVVLFFHATRCPSCVALDNTIQDELGDLAKNIVVFKADYDNTALSDSYGVTKQHTLVSLDGNGKVQQSKGGIVTMNMLNALVN